MHVAYMTHFLYMNMKHKLLFHELMKMYGNMSSVGRSEPFKLKSIVFTVLHPSLIKFCFYLPIHPVDRKLKHRMAINTLCWIETHT